MRRPWLGTLLIGLASLAAAIAAAPDREAEYRARRLALVREIAAHGVRDSATLVVELRGGHNDAFLVSEAVERRALAELFTKVAGRAGR